MDLGLTGARALVTPEIPDGHEVHAVREPEA